MLTLLIINLLHHSECVCSMSTYNNVSIDGANGENTVWYWRRVSAAWVGVPQKARECQVILHWLEIGDLQSDLLYFEWHSQICSLRFMCKLWWLDSGREWRGVGGEIKGVEKVCHQQPARPSSGKEGTADYIAGLLWENSSLKHSCAFFRTDPELLFIRIENSRNVCC